MEETTESAGKNVVNDLCDAIRYIGDGRSTECRWKSY